jgi:hypothetical protein
MTETLTHRSFNTRALWSVLAAASGVGLPWTGIENHLHHLDPLTSVRHAWMAAHFALGALFTVATLAHVALNRRPLWRQVRTLTARIPLPSREGLAALALTAGLLLLAVGHTWLVPGPR